MMRYAFVTLVAAVLALSGCVSAPQAPPAPPAPPPPQPPAPAPALPSPEPGLLLDVPPRGETATPEEAPTTPAVLNVVAHLNIAAGEGNISDVWAHQARDGRSYAYLGTYHQPACGPDITGVHIVDISDPARPQRADFIPSPPGTYVSDVRAIRVETPLFQGDLLLFSLERCRQAPAPEGTGIAIYDITNPLAPSFMAQTHTDFEAHNVFAYQQDERAFALVVQDDAERDFHIVDITNPALPRHISARGGVDWFDPTTDQLALGQVPTSFLHDMWAQVYARSLADRSLAGRTIAYLSYWDAGLVVLDITDPNDPVFLGDSDYIDPDPLTGLPPEGNSHTTVPTADGKLVFMGDEDFSPFGGGVEVEKVFDGWGYARILDVSNPARIVEVGRFATRGALDPSAPPGDHSIHNAVIDGRRAYVSWYADGILVVDFSRPEKPFEVAGFVDTEAGSDFWGVYLYRHPNGKSYILGSDRSTGLWVFDAP